MKSRGTKPGSSPQDAAKRKTAGGARATHEPATHFLNVDLDVLSRADVSKLVAAFGGCNLYNGKTRRGYLASFETSRQASTLESTMRSLIRRVHALGGPARKLWEWATRRDFNVGVQAGEGPRSYEVTISSATLAAIAAVGGRLVVTVYGSRTDDAAPVSDADGVEAEERQ